MADFDFEALGSAIGSALAKGLEENEVRKGQREQERAEHDRQLEEAAQIAERRRQVLEEIARTFEEERQAICRTVEGATGSVLRKVRANVREGLQNDPRMPRTINYVERYNALRGLEDRKQVLSLLKGTLELADIVLDDAGGVDVQAAIVDAAGKFRANMHVLDGVIVSQPELRADGLAEEADSSRLIGDQVESLGFGELLQQAFYQSFGEMSDMERLAMEADKTEQERKEALDKRIEEACEAAMQAGDACRRTLAQGVAGKVLRLGELPAFAGQTVTEPGQDVALVKQLAAKVQESFKTFSQVVQDNGLYAAFSVQGDYGACRGYSYTWWDSFDDYDIEFGYVGRRRPLDRATIPSGVEEDEGGDSVERAIERMAEFNKQPYDGFLDDDFQQHVDAFWYGFRKLMEGVNGLFEVDLSEFNGYCSDLVAEVTGKVRALAAPMDQRQATKFSNDIVACAKKLEA